MISQKVFLSFLTHFYKRSLRIGKGKCCPFCKSRTRSSIYQLISTYTIHYKKGDDIFTCLKRASCSRIMKASRNGTGFDFIVIKAEIDNISLVLMKCGMSIYLRRYILQCFILEIK